MEKDTLYIANTKINHDDFGITEYKLIHSLQQQFIQKTKEQIPNFDFPYMALFDNGTYLIIQDVTSIGSSHAGGKVVDGICPSGRGFRDDCTLAEMIDDYIVGLPIDCEGTRRTKSLTGVIEFSPKELYPDAIQELSKKYDIKKIKIK